MSENGVVNTGSESAKPLRKRRTRLANDKRIADDEFMAAAIGDAEWLRQSLREQKGKINFDKNGLAAIHLSAIHGRLDCLKLLIEKYKVNINLPSTTGWRAVHLCISNQTGKRALQCLQYLLNKNADTSVPNSDGITPVHQAASEGHVQCLKLLIDVGAKIDGKDCRGHTPLDLAKLWGHKKCARILAAEMWHQDKDNVARELGHLRKMKMQQVLREIEQEEEHKATQEKEGEKAFDEWLQKRNLPKQAVGPKGKTREQEETSKKATNREPLMKPNSIVKGKGATSSVGRKSERDTPKIHVAFREQRSPSPFGSRRVTDLSDDQGLYGNDETDRENKENKETSSKESKKPGFYNPESWKLALHPPGTEYIQNLKDDFPRDMYTRMPKVKSAPMYFDGKHGPRIYVTDEKLKSKRIQKDVKSPRLPQETIDEYLAKDPTRNERPVLFQPVHISDVNKKKKYSEDIKGKSEVSLHVCDDFSSLLYQGSLTRGSTFAMGEKFDYAPLPSSEWSSARYPREKVINTLKMMSSPSTFPSIRGEDYDLNFGDIATI